MPLKAQAMESVNNPTLIISEIKVVNDTSGYDEFIELYNASTEEVTLSDFQLEYFNFYDPESPAVTVHNGPTALSTVSLEPGAFYVLAKTPITVNDRTSAAQPFSTLKDSSGFVQLLGPDPTSTTVTTKVVHDSVAWGADLPTSVYPAPSKTFSLQRQFNEDGELLNLAVPRLSEAPTPFTYLAAPPEEDNEPEPSPAPLPQPDDGDEENNPQEPPAETPSEATPEVPALLPLKLSELLPNPASPQTDANDEYVELFNPNDEPIDLAGYTVQTGSSYSYSFTIENGSIPAHSYFVITSGQSNLALANSAGQARLLDPRGQVIAESAPYSEADDGAAWAWIGDSWQWTTTPTPNAANTLTTPTVTAAGTTKSTKSATKKTKAATSKKPKSTAKKAKAVKSASTKKSAKTGERSVYQEPEEGEEATPLHPAILAGIGGLTLLYAAYEYRQDVANRVYQFRRYRAARRHARLSAQGR